MAEKTARLISTALDLTLELPWWPTDVTNTLGVRQVAELERPGKQSLAVPAGLSGDAWSIGYLARHKDLRISIDTHRKRLARLAKSKKPVQLVFGDMVEGLFRFDSEPSCVIVTWTDAGEPASMDVSIALRAASQATVRTGPVAVVKGALRKAARKGKA